VNEVNYQPLFLFLHDFEKFLFGDNAEELAMINENCAKWTGPDYDDLETRLHALQNRMYNYCYKGNLESELFDLAKDTMQVYYDMYSKCFDVWNNEVLLRAIDDIYNLLVHYRWVREGSVLRETSSKEEAKAAAEEAARWDAKAAA
jgi:hypothetical protein